MEEVLLKKELSKAVLISNNVDFSDFRWLEFAELVKAAEIIEVGRMVQSRTPDPAYFIGCGKARELATMVEDLAADMVISMNPLTAAQVRNLSELTKVAVLDRTGLILEIFAQRAQTGEGKLQVELAQLNYMLPRAGAVDPRRYSRSGGGIGAKGVGESRVELTKRVIRERIRDLEKELQVVAKNRDVQRRRREKNEIPTIALVGYTNAGKSTLFNKLTGDEVSEANRLFETLDPIARRVELNDGCEAIFLDTVGFVSDLPHQLVAAFKATLEESVRATLKIHVMDASNPNLEEQYSAVCAVLDELKIDRQTVVNVLNKVDQCLPNEIQRLATLWDAFPISAHDGRGIDELSDHLQKMLSQTVQTYEFILPYNEAAMLNIFHENGQVLKEEYNEDGIALQIKIDSRIIGKYQKRLGIESCLK